MSNQWPYTTPSGHVFNEPKSIGELQARHGDASLGLISGWDADEMPPNPTWKMVGLALNEIRRSRSVVAGVRELHSPYLPTAVNYDCCAHCNHVSSGYVAWPCQTIVALGEVS